jgi:hypothetical protein
VVIERSRNFLGWAKLLMRSHDCGVDQLRAEGKNCDDHILSLTTPLMRKHLNPHRNPFGRYYFDLNRMRRLQGEIP